RELRAPLHFLREQVAADHHALAERDAHVLTSFGRRNRRDSVVVVCSSTSAPPSAATASIKPLTTDSGADAPADTPTVAARASQERSTSVSSSTRYAGVCSRSATSTRRSEFDEVREPTTITTSERRATSRTAAWRFVVA